MRNSNVVPFVLVSKLANFLDKLISIRNAVGYLGEVKTLDSLRRTV
jgi:hypothetical protein